MYTEKDYSTFTDDDIALFVAYKLLMNNDTATSEEIQELVKNYFGKENYKLQSKEYLIDSELYDYIDHKVIISETNGTYKSNLHNDLLTKTAHNNFKHWYDEMHATDASDVDHKKFCCYQMFTHCRCLLESDLQLIKNWYDKETTWKSN